MKKRYRASLSSYSMRRLIKIAASSKYRPEWDNSIKILYADEPPIVDYKLVSDPNGPIMMKSASLPNIKKSESQVLSNQKYREKYLLGGKEDQDKIRTKINLTNRVCLLPRKVKKQTKAIKDEEEMQNGELKKLMNEIKLKHRYFYLLYIFNLSNISSEVSKESMKICIASLFKALAANKLEYTKKFIESFHSNHEVNSIHPQSNIECSNLSVRL